jgi:hypothetical protein
MSRRGRLPKYSIEGIVVKVHSPAKTKKAAQHGEGVRPARCHKELLIASWANLCYNGNLTGRPVSNSSTTYPAAAYGWMSDAVHLGYQAALVSMHSPTYGRLWLSVERHPGDTVSVSQAAALARAAEAQTGARPWRRTDLLTARIANVRIQMQAAATELARAQARLRQTRLRLDQLEHELVVWQQQLATLAEQYRQSGRPERPHSRLAQARHGLQVREGRWKRRCRELDRDFRRWERCQHQSVQQGQRRPGDPGATAPGHSHDTLDPRRKANSSSRCTT